MDTRMSEGEVGQIESGDQIVRYDRAQTEQAYSVIKRGGAEICGCSYCRNFAAQRDNAFPATFFQLLDMLGIDPTKEGKPTNMDRSRVR
jgi:hypothetical protein